MMRRVALSSERARFTSGAPDGTAAETAETADTPTPTNQHGGTPSASPSETTARRAHMTTVPAADKQSNRQTAATAHIEPTQQTTATTQRISVIRKTAKKTAQTTVKTAQTKTTQTSVSPTKTTSPVKTAASASRADASPSDVLPRYHLRLSSAPEKPDEAEMPSPADMPKRREHDVARQTFAALSSHELPVVREYSAGGLIFNTSGEVAIIARHSRSGHLEWCLPKGHIEKGETPEQTAVREVHEETGIKGEVTGSIATIDYWFTGENQRVHKLVHHFVLRQTSGHLTVEGDPDHEAEDAAWVPFHELTEVLSYPNERRIVHLYARKFRRRS